MQKIYGIKVKMFFRVKDTDGHWYGYRTGSFIDLKDLIKILFK